MSQDVHVGFAHTAPRGSPTSWGTPKRISASPLIDSYALSSAVGIITLAAPDERIQTRGRRGAALDTVVGLEQVWGLGRLESGLVHTISLGTQLGDESLTVVGLELTQPVDPGQQDVTLGLELTEQVVATVRGIDVHLIGIGLGIGLKLLGVDTSSRLDALGASLGIDGELVNLSLIHI